MRFCWCGVMWLGPRQRADWLAVTLRERPFRGLKVGPAHAEDHRRTSMPERRRALRVGQGVEAGKHTASSPQKATAPPTIVAITVIARISSGVAPPVRSPLRIVM